LVYDIAGDAFSIKNSRDSAVFYWRKALTLEIPKQREREAIELKYNIKSNKKRDNKKLIMRAIGI